MTAHIVIDEAAIADIRQRASGGGKVLPEFAADVVDDAGKVIARVRKTLYVRLKRPASPVSALALTSAPAAADELTHTRRST